jgi:hypothetical protein
MSQTVQLNFAHPTHGLIVTKNIIIPDGEVLNNFVISCAKHSRRILVDHLFKELKKHPADISWAAFSVDQGIKSAQSFLMSEKWEGK